MDTQSVARMVIPASLLSMHVPAMPEPSSSFIKDFAGSLVGAMPLFVTSGAKARALEMNSAEIIGACKYRGIIVTVGLALLCSKRRLSRGEESSRVEMHDAIAEDRTVPVS